MTAVFTFASPWALSLHGREDVLRAFRATNDCIDAEIVPDITGAQCVSMRCTEQCFIAFVEFVTKYYHEELARESDTFEEPKLIRISGTSASGVFQVPDDPTASRRVIPALHDQLIEHETCRLDWTPTKQDDFGNITLKLLRPVMGRLETLTHTRIEQLSDKHHLQIIGDAESIVANAVRKLEVLEEMMSYQTPTHDFAILESEMSVSLQLLPLKELLDSRLKSTLVSPASILSRSLPSSYTLAIVKEGKALTSNPKGREGDSEYLWQGHELSIEGHKGSKFSEIKASPITRWVDTSNEAPVADPFAPLTWTDTQPEPIASSQLRQPPPEKPSIKRVRKVKGAAEAPRPHSSLTTLVKEVPNVTPGHDSSESWGQMSSHQMTPYSIQPEKAYQPSTPSQSIMSQFQQPPTIRPPFMPPPSILSSGSSEPVHSNWEDRVASAHGANTGTLIELDSPEGHDQRRKPSQEKHRTMNQRKPPVMASSNQLIKIYEKHVLEMLYNMRARPNVQLKVVMGRLLIDRQKVPVEYRKRTFTYKEWSSVATHLHTDFTERLTTKSSDVSNIINVKVKNGRRLFGESAVQQDVSYRIECLSRSNERIHIYISETGKSTVQGAANTNGVINWHYAKRTWDVRLILSSEEFLGGHYSQEAQNIANSMRRSPSTDGQGLTIEFNDEGSLKVQSMLLQRGLVYGVPMYPDLLLHVTEVQDLKVKQSSNDTYTTTIKPQDEMIASHQLWWEVSICSQKASTVTKESVELGEYAQWKPQEVTENGVVGDMYALADEIVTRIDHVGLQNNGPAASGSKGTKMSGKSFELPTGPRGYW